MAPLETTIGIAGAGAVAQALGRVLQHGGQPIAALASRTPAHAERAAAFIGPDVRVVAMSELSACATHVLIAVADDAIGAVADRLLTRGMRMRVAIHTCGAKGPSVLAPLRNAGVACGVLHPLQTIRTPEQGVRDVSGATFAVAGDPPALEWCEAIVALVNGRPLHIDPDRFATYHAGAVLASNALVASIDAAVGLLVQAGVDHDEALAAVAPLARASVENVLTAGPARALTGPVVRGDAATVAAHLDGIQDAPPSVRELYRASAGHLLRLARERGLADESRRRLQKLLDASVEPLDVI